MRRVVAAWAALCVACSGAGSDGGDPDASTGLPTDEPYPPGAPVVSWFADVTAASGVEIVHAPTFDDRITGISRGVAVEDIDGDGLLDIVATRVGAEPIALRNRGGLGFEPATTFAVAATAVCAVDLDNDGDVDIAFAGDEVLAVFWNDGSGGFDTPPTTVSDLGNAIGILPVDLDLDGALDLYISATWRSSEDVSGRADTLLRNAGGQAFELWDAPVDVRGYTWATAAADLDSDGRPDLYVGNDTFVPDRGDGLLPPSPAVDPETDRLYTNTEGAMGELALVDSSEAAGIDRRRSTMGIIVADMTGDSAPDLYLSDFGHNELFEAQGDGTFVDVADDLGVGVTWRDDRICSPGHMDIFCMLVSWGSAYEDFDLDGARDLVVLNSQTIGSDVRQPTAVFRGVAGGALEPVQTELGWMAGRSLVAADLDDDGDLDLVITTFEGPVLVFENLAPSSSWLRVRAIGTASNRSGVGAVVELELDDGRVLTRRIGVGGQLHSWSPSEAHFGVGTAAIAELRVRWPGGDVQSAGAVGADQIVDVVEGSP
jgi:hypothetical protein